MNSGENFAKHPVLQLTKRELHRAATSSKFWIGLCCVVVVLAISGPFDTEQDLTHLQRVAYWAGIAVSTYFLAICMMVPLVWLGETRNWHWLLTSFAAGIAAGIPIGWLVYVVNTFVAMIDNGDLGDFIRLELICIVIAISVACLRHVLTERPRNSTSQDLDLQASESVAFLKRLSPEIRGEVLTLQAQDHYVEVTTDRGKDLVLVRLGDAIAELPETAGRQTHRSWWIARSAVKSLKPNGDRLAIELVDGRTAPVSRAREKEIRSWIKEHIPAGS